MMTTLACTIVCLSFICSLAVAQRYHLCQAPELSTVELEKDFALTKVFEANEKIGRRLCNGCIIVETFFHVVMDDQGSEGYLSDAQVKEAMSYVNAAYTGTPFQFQLNEITRTTDSVLFEAGSGVNSASHQSRLGAVLRQGDRMTLNIYSLQLLPTTLGLGTFPSGYSGVKDGVFIDHCVVPNSGCISFTNPEIIPHEVGHWLGLFHTFQGGCNDAHGDYVSDTPAMESAAFDCHFPRNSCPEIPGEDALDNIMGYALTCMTEFTPGQMQRMYSQWMIYREGTGACGAGEGVLSVELKLDKDPEENSWTLFHANGQVFSVAEFGESEEERSQTVQICVPYNAPMYFMLEDKGGNGLKDTAEYKVRFNGKLIRDGIDFERRGAVAFTMVEDSGCVKGRGLVKIEMLLDAFPRENSLSIVDATGEIVYSEESFELNGKSAYFKYASIWRELCLPFGSYSFTFSDAYGDGMKQVGNRPPPFFRLLSDNQVIAEDFHITGSGRTVDFFLQSTNSSISDGSDVFSSSPSTAPTRTLTNQPTLGPNVRPTANPSSTPTETQSETPTATPSESLSEAPSENPTVEPSRSPTEHPSRDPTFAPTLMPTANPSLSPSIPPSDSPTGSPTNVPSLAPSVKPTVLPSYSPTQGPTKRPTPAPTPNPTLTPTERPTLSPTSLPTANPSLSPTTTPSDAPSLSPTLRPSDMPTQSPSKVSSMAPSESPTVTPSYSPTQRPTTVPTIPPRRSPMPIHSQTLPPASLLTPSSYFNGSLTMSEGLPTLPPIGPPKASPNTTNTFSPTPSPSMAWTPSPTTSPMVVPTGTPMPSNGIAIWATPRKNMAFSLWDGSSFGPTLPMARSKDRWRLIQGAASASRDEIFAIGFTSETEVRAQMYLGSKWNELKFSPLSSENSDSFWWAFDVKYESQSGNALMVWSNGSTGKAGISYRIWDNSRWSSEQRISVSISGEPKQMQLAANPKSSSNEMVLIVSQSSSYDYAVVWDGTRWSNEQVLNYGSGDRTDVYVAYEQKSGRAMVVYAKAKSTLASSPPLHYRVWDGTWSAEGSVTPPSGIRGDVRWATLGADPSSNRIAVGAITWGPEDMWLAVWDGDTNTWGSEIIAAVGTPASIFPGIAVAFEGSSGKAMATYGLSDGVVRYRTWAGSWSHEMRGPDLGDRPNSMMLAGDPRSNRIMLSVQDAEQAANFVLWDGTTWGAVKDFNSNTGETKNQPFLFLWR